MTLISYESSAILCTEACNISEREDNSAKAATKLNGVSNVGRKDAINRDKRWWKPNENVAYLRANGAQDSTINVSCVFSRIGEVKFILELAIYKWTLTIQVWFLLLKAKQH